jgi:hypothetical protein
MCYLSVDLALHHRWTIVVFDKAFPTGLDHKTIVVDLIFLEALFAEIIDRVVVCVGEKVVNILWDCVVLKFVHQTSSVSLYLFGSCDCEKHNFCKFLRRKRSENTTSQDDWLLSGYLFHDDHGLVHPIHDKTNDVWSRHARQLLCDDVL